MRNIIALVCLAATICFSGNAIGQQKIKTEISSVKRKGKTVDFNIASSKPFIFGSNRYVLHVGRKEFILNKQSKKDGKGLITFFIPLEEYFNLSEENSIYLTYGDMSDDETELQERSKTSPNRCFYLGKFSNTLLTK